MEELIIGLYKNKINFKFQFGLLTVGQEWQKGSRSEYNKVEFNYYNDEKWHVEHYYKGYWQCEQFNNSNEVLKFFIEREL